jgi:DNA-binding MarR family transcriptional regulator
MAVRDDASDEGFVLDQPGGNVALDLFVLDQHLGSFLTRAFEGTGIGPSQYAVYSQLAQGPATPRELCRTLGLRPTTLSGYLAAMDRAGHLHRARSTRDRRSSTLCLTPSGEDKAEEGRLRMRTAVTALHSALGGADQVAAVRAVLGTVDRAVVAAERRLPPP